VFVLYAKLDPKTFQRMVPLIAAGFTNVVLFGYDDSKSRFSALLQDSNRRASAPMLGIALENYLDRLPQRLRVATQHMIAEPSKFRSTQDLAAAANMSARAVFRHLRDAGVKSPRRFVASARVVRAFELLEDQGRTVAEVAARLGYPSADQLSAHFSELTGRTAGEARKTLTLEPLIKTVVRAMNRSGARVARDRVSQL
jgi:AraC-like DNA-binding protein